MLIACAAVEIALTTCAAHLSCERNVEEEPQNPGGLGNGSNGFLNHKHKVTVLL